MNRKTELATSITASINPDCIQEIPPVIQKEIDRIDYNAKGTAEVVSEMKKTDPYSLVGFKHEAEHIMFCSYWHGGNLGTQFYWKGRVGNIFETIEEIEGATNQGDVRMFFGIPFYASNVHASSSHQKVGWFRKEYKYWRTTIAWSVPNATDKWIAEFKRALFR